MITYDTIPTSLESNPLPLTLLVLFWSKDLLLNTHKFTSHKFTSASASLPSITKHLSPYPYQLSASSTMLRSITILSSAVAVATIMSDPAAAAATPVPQHELWYPDFASDYESGRCTTSPSPTLISFVEDSWSPDISTLAQHDKAACCEIWYPTQERCGCLGGCADRSDDAIISRAPIFDEEPSSFWYPQFDETIDGGKCVRVGDANPDDSPPSYYTQDNGFLHASLDSCCDWWFGHEQTNSCTNALDSDLALTLMAGVNLTSAVKTEVVLQVQATQIYYQSSRSLPMSEETR